MKTYTTEQVFQLLKKHPTWTFAAPETQDKNAAVARSVDGIPKVFIVVGDSETEDEFCRMGGDSDWVRTNKPKPIRIDRVKGATRIGIWYDTPANHSREYDTKTGSWCPTEPTKTYKVYLVECD